MKMKLTALISFLLLSTVFVNAHSLDRFLNNKFEENFLSDDFEVCSTESIPGKYVKTDSYFQNNRCNGAYLDDLYSKSDLSAPDNVWVLTKYTDLEEGDELEICYNSPLPSGWKRIDSYFQNNRCDGAYLDDVASKRDLSAPDNVYIMRKIE